MDLKILTKENLSRGKINSQVMKIVSNTDVLIMAYSKIKSKPGNMTPGTDSYTLDGIDIKWFERVSQELQTGTFCFKPSKRVEIPKSNGGSRPLGVVTPRDKIIQEAMRMVLEAVFEPNFSKHSHGFRPKRSCHSCLREIKNTFTYDLLNGLLKEILVNVSTLSIINC